MASFLPHIVVPALVALAFLPIGRRRVLMWAPLVWVPDVDYVLPALHRAASHSVFIPLLLTAVLVWLWRRRDPTARFPEFATRPGAPANLTLASFYLASHLVMDVFQGGVVLLWPLWNVTLFLGFQIVLDTATNTFEPAGDAGSMEGAPPLSARYEWFSTTDAAVTAFLVAFGLGWVVLRLWQRWRGTRPPAPLVLERKATPTGLEKDGPAASPIQKG